MHEVEVDGHHILRRRIEGRVRIERIARLKHKKLPEFTWAAGLIAK